MAALLIQKRACREKTLPSSEGRTLSGRSVVSKAHRNKRRERSSVERGERTTRVPQRRRASSAETAIFGGARYLSVGMQNIAAGRGKP